MTEPGRGYRFVADVKAIAVSSAGPAQAERPASAPAASTARNSIAVLPFANMTGDAAKEYFSDGMAEELIRTLARIPGLKVPTAWTFIWMPEMRPFREDPRFQQFCARLNFFEYWNQYGPPDNHELRDGKLICK